MKEQINLEFLALSMQTAEKSKELQQNLELIHNHLVLLPDIDFKGDLNRIEG